MAAKKIESKVVGDYLPKLEDLYKISEDLDFFYKKHKAVIDRAGTQVELLKLVQDECEEMCDPDLDVDDTRLSLLATYKQKKDIVSEIKAGEKDKIKDGSTKIYEGPEGTIYLLHRKEASQLLGRQTRWCIAAAGDNCMFDEYNTKGPIFVFETKPTPSEKVLFNEYTSFKFARAYSERCFRDELDDEIDMVPDHDHPLGRLYQAAIGSLKTGQKAYFKAMTSLSGYDSSDETADDLLDDEDWILNHMDDDYLEDDKGEETWNKNLKAASLKNQFAERAEGKKGLSLTIDTDKALVLHKLPEYFGRMPSLYFEEYKAHEIGQALSRYIGNIRQERKFVM